MDVEAILATSRPQHKNTEVNKEVELQFDLRNLLATDLNSIDTGALRYVRSRHSHMEMHQKLILVLIIERVKMTI